MANDCLVKRLKGVVDNDNLPEYGTLAFDVPANSISDFVNFNVGGFPGQVLSWNGGVTMEEWGGGFITSPYEIPINAPANLGFKLHSGNTDGTVRIKSKYAMVEGTSSSGLFALPLKYGENNIKSISYWFKGKNLVFGLDRQHVNDITGNVEELAENCPTIQSVELESCPNLNVNINRIDFSGARSFSCHRSGIVSGSLASFKNTGVGNIAFQSSELGHITGDIVDAFGSNIALTELCIYKEPNITGSIENFVAAQRAAGRTTGTITIGFDVSGVTYNGNNTIPYSSLTWDANSITVTPL